MSDRELRKSTREASEKTNICQEARQNAKQSKKQKSVYSELIATVEKEISEAEASCVRIVSDSVRDEYHFPPRIRISNIFEISILHEYEYKYIRDIEFGPNTNMNIFVHAQYSNIRIFWYE